VVIVFFLVILLLELLNPLPSLVHPFLVVIVFFLVILFLEFLNLLPGFVRPLLVVMFFLLVILLEHGSFPSLFRPFVGGDYLFLNDSP
jgi:hypothetical protein